MLPFDPWTNCPTWTGSKELSPSYLADDSLLELGTMALRTTFINALCSFTQCTWVYYIDQMNFQVNIYFPHTFQMYFWTISFLSWPFQMMNLNRPSEFSALNFCFDLTGSLCSILNWNLLKILSRTRTSPPWTKIFTKITIFGRTVRKKHLVLVEEFAISKFSQKSGKTRVFEENFSLDLTLKIPILQPSLESGFY